MRSLCAALLAAALILTGGCSGDPEPRTPRSTWTPTGTPDSPSTAAAPVEPPLPGPATEPTEAGARAFIAYYWELVNYAQVTGDVAALKRASAATCAGCQRLIHGISDLYRGGGHAVGGEYRLTVDHSKQLKLPSDAPGVEISISVRNNPQVIVDASGRRQTSSSATSRFLAYLIWPDKRWRIDIMEPR